MMQDIYGVSRYIDPLVHQYTITTSRLHAEDITISSFVYSFDVFHRCNNPSHVNASDALSTSTTKASIPFISTFYYTPIKCSTICSFRFVHPIQRQDTECYTLPVSVTLYPPIIWISFESVINSLAHFYFVNDTMPYNAYSENQISFHFLLQTKILLTQQYIWRYSRIHFLLFSIDYHYCSQLNLPHQVYYRINSLNKLRYHIIQHQIQMIIPYYRFT